MVDDPVGNQPRKRPEKEKSGLSGISGNSHRAREANEQTTSDPEREPIEKIVEGKVVSRKQPWYKRFSRTMVAEDAGTIGEYLLMEVVIPGMKGIILQIGTQGLERALFGSTNGRIGRRSPLGASLRDQFNYNRISDRDRDLPLRRPMSREARARHDFNEIVLESRSEAIEVVEALIERIARYGAVSVADLYDFVGTTGSFADQRWGWDDLNTADVRQVPGGFLLDLPAPEPIR